MRTRFTSFFTFVMGCLAVTVMMSCRKDAQIPTAAMVRIDLVADPMDAGTVIGDGMYLPGTSLTVTATPSANYYFKNWKENGLPVSTDASYSFIAETDRTLVAEFYDFRDPVTGNYSGTKHNYSWIMGNPPTTSDTTFAYSFSVSKHPTSMDSIIVDGGTFPIDTSLSFSRRRWS